MTTDAYNRRDRVVNRRLAIPSDTDTAAHDVQRDIYLRIGGGERLAIAFRLTDSVRSLAMSGIRRRHPDYTEDQVRLAFARLRLGDALVRTVWPDHSLVDP
jgi:hypothetical protein